MAGVTGNTLGSGSDGVMGCCAVGENRKECQHQLVSDTTRWGHAHVLCGVQSEEQEAMMLVGCF